MVNALVDNLGQSAASGARAFPTAEAMASVPESFYRETGPSRVPQRVPPRARFWRGRRGIRGRRTRRPSRPTGRRGCVKALGPPRNRAIRRGPSDDAPRAALPTDPGLVDTPQVREGQRVGRPAMRPWNDAFAAMGGTAGSRSGSTSRGTGCPTSHPVPA